MNQSESISQKSEPKAEQPEGAQPKDVPLQQRPRVRDGIRAGHRVVYPISTKTKTGVSWTGMMNRCYNKNVACYPEYGGRGILACVGFRKGPHFLVHAIGRRPQGTTLDRIDFNGHYSCGRCIECLENGYPLNVRWATPKQQRVNQRRTELIEINGVKHSCSEWAEMHGLPFNTVYGRLRRYGWTGDRLIAPATDPREGAKKVMLDIDGVRMCMSDWGRKNGIATSVIHGRLKRGWTPKQAATTPPLKPHQRINELEKKVSPVVDGSCD